MRVGSEVGLREKERRGISEPEDLEYMREDKRGVMRTGSKNLSSKSEKAVLKAALLLYAS